MLKKAMIAAVLLGCMVGMGTGCGGSDALFEPFAFLAGAWFGTITTDSGPTTMEWMIASNGTIEEVREGGGLLSGVTGTIVSDQGNAYQATLSDGRLFRFLLHSSFLCMGLVYLTASEFHLGILEKGSTSLPAYSEAMIRNRLWAGAVMSFTVGFLLAQLFNGSLLTDASGGFTGQYSNGETFTDGGSPFTLSDAVFGIWTAGYFLNAVAVGFMTALLSPSGRFMMFGAAKGVAAPLDEVYWGLFEEQ